MAHHVAIAAPIACVHQREWLLIIEHGAVGVLCSIQIASVNLHLVSAFYFLLILIYKNKMDECSIYQ